MLLLIILLLFLFGGGGYYGYSRWGSWLGELIHGDPAGYDLLLAPITSKTTPPANASPPSIGGRGIRS